MRERVRFNSRMAALFLVYRHLGARADWLAFELARAIKVTKD
jgi:hypothetical protein